MPHIPDQGFPQSVPNLILEGQFDDVEEDYLTSNHRNHSALFHHQYVKDDSKIKSGDNFEETESSDDSVESDDEDYEFYGEKTGPNSQGKAQIQMAIQSAEDLFKKYANKISVEKFEGVSDLPNGAGNKILSANKKATANRQKVKDKQDRATVEQVMDPRTRMILYKLLSNSKILSIDGCISTGKEANVYHATGPENTSYAIKIFKTSILTFKARDKYVSGEFRFRGGYCKKNPRKMVRLWAEKEFRNLLRIHSAGTVLVPQPRLLKSHVLVMDFIGDKGWPCPLLKDVKFDKIDFGDENSADNNQINSQSNDDGHNPLKQLLDKLYRDCLIILYKLYKHCKLVHADFSEFNLILKDYQDLYVIDVSQSVEHDHPRSFDFLKSDIKNIQEFFGKRQVNIGGYKEIFTFITSPSVDDSNYEDTLSNILKQGKAFEDINHSKDEVFRQSFIPRKMEEVVHYERDRRRARKGRTQPIYAEIMGMKPDLSGPKVAPNVSESLRTESESTEKNDDLSHNSDSGSESDSDSDEEKSKFKNSHRPKEETAEEKKERKKAVKQDRAEKRETKMKKHVKKRKEKLSHANSKRK